MCITIDCGFQNAIDGDLCEQYNSLDSSKRRSIAEELDRTPSEVCSVLCMHSYYPLISLITYSIYCVMD